MTSPNPGKEQGFLPESPSADAGPSPRSLEGLYEMTDWDVRRELRRVEAQRAKLAAEIQRRERERALRGLTRLPPHQRAVLRELMVDDWHDEIWCVYTRSICTGTGLIRPQVSRALKALRRYGFVEHQRGLFNDDGEVAGSGYRVTEAGHAWWWAREATPPKSSPGDRATSRDEGGLRDEPENPALQATGGENGR